MNPSLKICFCVILVLSFWNCNNHLSKKEYNRILDSLKLIEVPLKLDTIAFSKREYQGRNIHLPDSDGYLIFQDRKSNGAFYQEIRHKDSLFWDVFEYDNKGNLFSYYKKFFNNCGDYPIGYVITYNEDGKIESFHDGIWVGQQTGLTANYTIYDVINKLKNDSIELFKHNVFICFTDWSGKIDIEERNKEYYWIIGINYYHDYEAKNKKIKYQRKLRISPDTGEVLEDWIDQWE